MTTNNISKRVAELSATLAPIDEAFTFLHLSEVMGIADDFICYNSPYYCNGLQRVDFEATFQSCIFETCGEYQVLRFFATEVYNSGEGTYQYFANELAHQNEDDYMDYGEYDNELEKRGCTEFKQIWIDRHGKTETITLSNPISLDSEVFCSVRSMHEWVSTTPKVFIPILTNINEYDDYCHTYAEDDEIILRDIRKRFFTHARKFNQEFVDEITSHGFSDDFIHFFRTFMVLSKHHIALPKGYNDIRIYFNCLESLEHEGKCITEPRNINPTELIAAYHKEQDRLAKEREERAKRMAIEDNVRFNKLHAYLFGIEFDDDLFHYKSLDSVEAYRIEGEIMHHCIFRTKYYNRHDVLSMHITDHEGNRVATCSINVERGEIIELQTMCNDPEWRKGNEYKHIWNTLMARMHTFPRQPKEQESLTRKVA